MEEWNRRKKRSKKPKEGASWVKAPRTSSKKQRRCESTVDNELFYRMEKVATILFELEKTAPGKGILRNTPGAYIRYCIIATTNGIEKAMELQHARSQTAHNTG